MRTLSLSSRQHFGDHTMMDAELPLDHVLAGLSFSQGKDLGNGGRIRPKPLG